VRYADIYSSGQCGVEPDLVRAIQIDEDGCRRHEPLACRAAARLLDERRKLGDVALAIALLETSCRAAKDCVDIDLFTRLLRARNENDDAARALRFLTAACADRTDLGDAAKACQVAAEMYDRGEGAAPNARRARELRARAGRLWRAAGKPPCCAE
jgi:TPR repeat protein